MMSKESIWILNPGREIVRTADGCALRIISELTGPFPIYHPCQNQNPVMETRNTRDFPSDNNVNAHGLEAVTVPHVHGAYILF